MNTEQVISKLSKKYPNKKVIKLPEDNPTEILCEIDPATNHPEKSVAIAIIDKSEPHYHKKATEIYKITKGELTVFINNRGNKLKEGNSLTVKPGEIHYAIGDETWVEVYSEPGWTQEDHIKPLTDKEFIIFKNYLNETYEYFLFNIIGHKEVKNKIYHNKEKEEINFKYIWDTMLRISEFGYLSHLANMFDRPFHYVKGIKVDNIVFCRIDEEDKLIGCENTLKILKTVRNKILDHIDSDIRTNIQNNGKTISEVLGLDPPPERKDIQLLFDKIFELLRMKESQEKIRKTMEEKFEGWYNIFKKGYYL